MSNSTHRLTFEAWMEQVNARLETKFQVSAADIEDWDYRDAFDDGYTVNEAAKAAIMNAGWFE